MIQTQFKLFLVSIYCLMSMTAFAQSIPDNFSRYDRIYRICRGETLTIDNPIRMVQCTPPPNPIGLAEYHPFGQVPVWSSDGSNDFSVQSQNVGSVINFFPSRTTVYSGYYSNGSCSSGSGPALPAPSITFRYLVIVDESPNCTSTTATNFVVEACVGDEILIPSPNQIGDNGPDLCRDNVSLSGGNVVELVSVGGPFMRVRVRSTGTFYIDGLGGSFSDYIFNGSAEMPCPVLTYQYEIRLKPSCSNSNNNSIDPLFTAYPWLSIHVNPNSCSNEKIEEYRNGIYTYLLISNFGNGRTALYNADGRFYCEQTSGYDCIGAYNLSGPLRTWQCGGGSSTTPSSCNTTGTFFFQNCDNGQLYYFLRTDDGRVFDPYFNGGVSYSPVAGQKVKFDYVDANFSSPCSVAERAITITCIENVASTNSSNQIFSDYSWLSSIVNPNNCSGARVEVYQQPGYQFLFIETGGRGSLYLDDGTFYCQDSPNYNCRAAYRLSNPVTVWACNGNLQEIAENRTNTIAQLEGFAAYPNPTIGALRIQLPVLQQAAQLRMVNLFGQVMMEQDIPSSPSQQILSLDIGAYQNGVYYLELQTHGKRGIERIIKQDLR